jgi:hypothetical protein
MNLMEPTVINRESGWLNPHRKRCSQRMILDGDHFG